MIADPGDAVPARTPLIRHLLRLALLVASVGVLAYALLSYEFVPSAWRFVERRHPALAAMGSRAFTSAGIPGDPLNIAFIGSRDELEQAMHAAGWLPADPITLKSSSRIAYDSVARKPYLAAPVSDLYVNGKRQDLAFEKAAGAGPAQRHHVRFWQAEQRDAMGRLLWIGAATFDAGVGLSHTTGQVTHHIAADVDRERDQLVGDLTATGHVSVKWVEDFQPVHEGRNGGGDRFFTDARLATLAIVPRS